MTSRRLKNFLTDSVALALAVLAGCSTGNTRRSLSVEVYILRPAHGELRRRRNDELHRLPLAEADGYFCMQPDHYADLLVELARLRREVPQ